MNIKKLRRVLTKEIVNTVITDIDAYYPNIIEDAASALIGLGFQRGEALEALSAVKNLGDTAEDLVMLALKRIGR